MASDLVLRIGADTGALRNALNSARKDLKRFGFRAESVGRELTTRLSLPILGVGAAAVKTFATFDRLEKGLAAVSGSAAEGKRQFESLIGVVKDARTTLDLKGAVTASLQLQAAGRSASDTENILRQLGIAATASGAAADDVGEVGRQLAQAASKGRILQQELRIVLERIPAISQIMKDEFGVITAEALRDAGVSADEFITRLTKAIEENERLQNIGLSLAKVLETVGIEFQLLLFRIGNVISESLNLRENLPKLISILTELTVKIENLSPATQRLAVVIGLAVSSFGPLTFSVGVLARSLPLLTSGFEALSSPFSLLLGGFPRLGKSVLETAKNKVLLIRRTERLKNGAVLLNTALISSAVATRTFKDALASARVATFGLVGPLGLAIAGIGLLVAGFIKAWRNSETFRNIIRGVGDRLESLVQVVFPSFRLNLEAIGKVANVVFSAIGAGITFLIVGFQKFIERITNAGSAVKAFFSGNFEEAKRLAQESILSPVSIIDSYREAGEQAAKVFTETFNKSGSSVDFSTLAQGVGVIIPDDDDDPSGGGGGGGGRRRERLNPFFFQRIGQSQLDIARFSNFIDSVYENVEEPGLEFQSSMGLVNEAIAEYRKQLDATVSKQIVFGESYKPIEERVKAAKELLTQLIDGTLPRNEEAIAKIRGEYEGYVAQLDAVKKAEEERAELLERQSQAVERLREVAETAFDSVARAMNQGASVFEAFGQAAVGAIRDVIAEQIKLAVVTAAADALKGLGILGLPLAAAAGAGAAALFNGLLQSLNIPLLADGGITQGAGLFVAGEAGPEAIIPLDRLNEFMRPGASELYGEIRADGSELLVVMQAAQARQNRSYGN
jgi:tape measure domain-containing protein